MDHKLYQCKYPGCLKQQPILSKGLCTFHREMQRREEGEQTFSSKKHTIVKSKKKTLDKRKETRECLKSYFDILIGLLQKNPRCENCDRLIKAHYLPYNNIAHILSKSSHKSVMCNLDNHMFLCDSKDREDFRSCHHAFDNMGFEYVKSMPVFEVALQRFEKIKPFVLEKTNIFHKFDTELEKL